MKTYNDFLGVVILYYPDVDVWENIQTYLPYLDKLIIWDNTPNSGMKIEDCYKRLNSDRVVLLGNNSNVGVGKALNEAAKYALLNGYSYLLTMDQDSSFLDDDFEKYEKYVINNKDQSCMAFCVGGGESEIQNEEELSEVKGFITSGTIHPVSVFLKLGFFREDFFIDAIDCEFGCRIRKSGYKIIRANPIRMNHRLGYPLVYRLWRGGKDRVTPNYSAIRTYYLTRNYFLLYRIYSNKEYEGYIWFLKIYCFWRPIAILVAETDKLRKMKMFFIGVIHGILGKSGEYIE